MVAMKCIIETYGREGKQKVNETYKNCIEFFYSLVLDALSEVVTPVRMNKIRKGIKIVLQLLMTFVINGSILQLVIMLN